LIPSIHCSPLCSIPLLKMTLTDFSIPYSYIYRKHINHIYFPLPFPPAIIFPLTWTCFIFLSFNV
jgi:hypothetical protein